MTAGAARTMHQMSSNADSRLATAHARVKSVAQTESGLADIATKKSNSHVSQAIFSDCDVVFSSPGNSDRSLVLDVLVIAALVTVASPSELNEVSCRVETETCGSQSQFGRTL